MVKKAAVVIGVNTTGGLTPLRTAAEGAARVAGWLESEGFDVQCLTDKEGPVKSDDVERAIGMFVKLPARYHLLVVYFSGHGHWIARSDRWLLSGAPTHSSQAINLDGAIDLARYSGIPNVVFISDACRSIPASAAGARVVGVDGFPNLEGLPSISKVDVFRATGQALSAYEVKTDGGTYSVLTQALMSAYEQPEPGMVRSLIEDQKPILVVPNRELEDYLQRKVDQILAAVDPNLRQIVEVSVPSKDDVYISKVRGDPQNPLVAQGEAGATGEGGQLVQSAGVGADAARAIDGVLAPRRRRSLRSRVRRPAPVPETEEAVVRLLPWSGVDHFETQCGFVVRGARVVAVETSAGVMAELLDGGDGRDSPAVIRLENVRPAASIAVVVEDRRTIVLAGLHGYVGHVLFDDVGVANVSYVPSSNNWRWHEYERGRTQVDRLRALVALAVNHNTFRIQSPKEAEMLASRIRRMKGMDPTLGIYAAHAYSQAGQEKDVLDVLRYMEEDLEARMFDVRVLASRQLKEPVAPYPDVPFCPMLTQSWNLLRPRRIEVSEVIRRAGMQLCDSLWTTFRPTVHDTILELTRTGGV